MEGAKMYRMKTLKQMSLEDLTDEEAKAWKYYELVRDVLKAKKQGII